MAIVYKSMLTLALLLGLCGCVSSPETTPIAENEGILGLMLGNRPSDPEQFATLIEEASAFDLGTEQNPVRVHMPQGQKAYLERLRCLDGTKPTYKRLGSFGDGPYGTILDGYELTCSGNETSELIYMDMYHAGHKEDQPVPGFKID